MWGALLGASRLVHPRAHRFRCFALAVTLLVVAHLSEAGFYAALLWFAEVGLGIGALVGPEGPTSAMDRFYFSLVNFTTLGRGDLVPTRHLRFLTAIEAFQGFLLITLSGAYLLQILQGRDPMEGRE